MHWMVIATDFMRPGDRKGKGMRAFCSLYQTLFSIFVIMWIRFGRQNCESTDASSTSDIISRNNWYCYQRLGSFWEKIMLKWKWCAKCATLAQYQLAGTKKVQQVLAKAGALIRFFSDESKIEMLPDTFAGLYSVERLHSPVYHTRALSILGKFAKRKGRDRSQCPFVATWCSPNRSNRTRLPVFAGFGELDSPNLYDDWFC